MTPAFLLLVMACPATLLTCRYAYRSNSNEIVTLHLIMFTLEMFIYGVIWTVYAEHTALTCGILAIVAVLLNLYVAATLLFSRTLTRFRGTVSLAALTITDQEIALGLAAWIWLKTVLFLVYGAASFGGLNIRHLAGVPQLLIDLDRFLLWPAWGAYFAYIIRPATHWRPRLVTLLVLLFLFINLLLDNTGGGKRVLLTTVLVFAVLRSSHRRFTIIKPIMWGLTLVIVMLLANYYETIRLNFAELVDTLRDQREATWTTLETAFVPRDETGFVQDLKIREAPISLLYSLTGGGVNGVIAHGTVLAQVLENIVPNGLFDKKFQDEDAAISAVFSLPPIDLATTNLAVIQAETYVGAYVVTPGLYIFVFWMYFGLLFKRLSRNSVSVLTAIETLTILGALICTSISIESSLTATLETLRDVVALLLVGYCMRFAGLAAARQEGMSTI